MHESHCLSCFLAGEAQGKSRCAGRKLLVFAHHKAVLDELEVAVGGMCIGDNLRPVTFT